MQHKVFLLLSVVAVFLPRAYSQNGSVTGTVTDSASGRPIVNLTVFIPFTSTGTTTNAEGNFTLEALPPGDYDLMFRHITYHPFQKKITIEAGKQINLSVSLAENTYEIGEVVKKGIIPDWKYAFNVFKRYFLGDTQERLCILRNQKELRFYYDGDTLIGYARKPLEIENRHLGYQIIYFLDYFKFFENPHPGPGAIKGSSYAYAGSALYQFLPTKLKLLQKNWSANRRSEFRASLKQFLTLLYANDLQRNRYYLRKAYLEKSFEEMDSVFYWDPNRNQSGFLYYRPGEEFRFTAGQIAEGPGSGEKTLSLDLKLLIFRDYELTADFLPDDWIATLFVPSGTLIFDRDGNFRTPDSQLDWMNLDNTVRMKVMLPTDYVMPIDH